jgi:hypothetical protein
VTQKELDVAARQAKALLPDHDAYRAAIAKIRERLMADGMPEPMARVAIDLAAGNPTE